MGASENQMGAPPNEMGAGKNQMGAPQNEMGASENQTGAPPSEMGVPENQMGVPPNGMGTAPNGTGPSQRRADVCAARPSGAGADARSAAGRVPLAGIPAASNPAGAAAVCRIGYWPVGRDMKDLLSTDTQIRAVRYTIGLTFLKKYFRAGARRQGARGSCLASGARPGNGEVRLPAERMVRMIHPRGGSLALLVRPAFATAHSALRTPPLHRTALPPFSAPA